MFPQAFIDEVRAAADIVAVVSESVSLRKTGATFKGLCPFHGEKTPSFHVNRDRGFFHCFGCGVGGDVFKFVELQEKVGFQDAVRHLAQRAGIPVPEVEGSADGGETAAERESLVRIHEVAVAYFREQLGSAAGAPVREYLRSVRGLTDGTVAALQLGFAPASRDALRQRLVKQGFGPVHIVRSGLVTRRDDGSEVDRFRNRLMIPIARDTGTVIAFGGRSLDPDQQPKYLNSPETPVYVKSRTLYGLNLTKAEIRKAGFALIVEGYFDFAQAYQAGGLPVVATCGTALGAPQIRLIRRFAPKALLCYDPDPAGQTAAERSSELLVAEGFDVNIVRLPGGEDPDTFIQKQGRDAFVSQLRTSQPYLEFLLDRAATEFDLGRDDSRREFLRRMLGVAARIPDPAVRDQFADRLAHKARVAETVVRDEIRKAAAARKTDLPAERLPSLVTHVRPAEKGLLWRLMHDPAATLPWLDELEPDDLKGLMTGGIIRIAQQLPRDRPEDAPNGLFERLSTQEAELLTALASEASPPVFSTDVCVFSLRRLRLEREQAEIQREIDRRQSAGETGALNALLERKLSVQRALEVLGARTR